MLRATYLVLAVLLCTGLAFLGLWPWAIKPHANAWVSEQIRQIGFERGLLLRTGEISISGFSEIEIRSTRVDDLQKRWSVQAPMATIEFSLLALLFGTQPLRSVKLNEPVFLGSFETSNEKEYRFEVPSGLKQIIIENGHVQIEDHAHQTAVRISHLDVKVGKRFGKYHLDIFSPEAWLERQKQNIDLTAFSLRGTFIDGSTTKHLEVRELKVESSKGALSANGKIILDKHYRLRDDSASSLF